MPTDQAGCKARMEEINGHVKEVSGSVHSEC